MYVYVYICVYIYIYTYHTHIYTYIYTYIHTYIHMCYIDVDPLMHVPGSMVRAKQNAIDSENVHISIMIPKNVLLTK